MRQKNMQITDELFQSAKEVKELFINQMMRWKREAYVNAEEFATYFALLKQLNQLFETLQTQKQTFAFEIEVLGEMLAKGCDMNLCDYYLAIMDELLLCTIQYRQYYCIIRRQDKVAGLASHFITNLGQIVISLQEGYIPVVDTYYTENVMTPLSKTMQKNAWELYFNQPFGACLNDALLAEQKAKLEGIPTVRPSYNMDCLGNPSVMQMWKKVFRKYMFFSDDMQELIASEKKRWFGDEPKKIMGVLCRGTDYLTVHPVGHPVQPEPYEMLERVRTQMQAQDCTHCYLATEDKDILAMFRAEFGEALICSQEMQYESNMEMMLSEYNRTNDVDLHRKNQEYLVALALLAECDCFMGGRTSGTILTLLLADEFSFVDIWNDGFYGVDSEQVRRGYII